MEVISITMVQHEGENFHQLNDYISNILGEVISYFPAQVNAWYDRLKKNGGPEKDRNLS